MKMSILNPKDEVRCKVKNNAFYFVAYEKIKGIDKLREVSKNPKNSKINIWKEDYSDGNQKAEKCETNYTKYTANTCNWSSTERLSFVQTQVETSMY